MEANVGVDIDRGDQHDHERKTRMGLWKIKSKGSKRRIEINTEIMPISFASKSCFSIHKTKYIYACVDMDWIS